ncbi:MAG: ABC transporter ATP-binding protein [bacterium]
MALFSEQEKTILSVKNLTLVYRRRRAGKVYALSDVSFDVRAGEILGIAGESGSGKSSVCKSILKLFREWEISELSGAVNFNGKNILDERDEELNRLRGGRIAMIFQQPAASFNPVMKIGRQIEEVMALHGCGRGLGEIFETVGLEERAVNLFPHNLSGGMLQRAQLAVALATGAEILIADEPTTSLDAYSQFEIINLLKGLVKKEHLTLIFVSHNLRLIKFLTERTLIFYGGFLVEEGPTEELFKNPLHPYTRDLMKCIPAPGSEIYPIKGFPLDMTEKPSGCSYRPRCSLASEICAGNVKLKREFHKVRCFYA